MPPGSTDLAATVLADLVAAIDPTRLLAPEHWPQAACEDVGHAALGRPWAWVQPQTTGEVAAVVTVARKHGVPVVAAGRRSAYWRPLAFSGAIVVDLSAQTQISEVDREHRVVWCQAGATLRDIDTTLRAAGSRLAAHPDACGWTSIGALVATGFTSGIGMALADVDRLVLGLELVLGTGAIVRTGAGLGLGAPPFLRTGLPDPTGLLFASEGALGIVTAVAVRAAPAGHRQVIKFGARDFAEVLAVAIRLRISGLYETFRTVDPGDAEIQAEIVVYSPVSAAELSARVAFVTAAISAELPGRPVTPVPDDQAAHTGLLGFAGLPGRSWQQTRQARLAPLDINLGYPDTPAAMAIGEQLLQRHRHLAWISRRRALYFTPDFVNFGLHGSLDLATSTDAQVQAFLRDGTTSLARLPLIPYRFGRVWGPALASRLDPGYHAMMRSLRETCDPAGILNPGVSIFAPPEAP